MSLQVDSNLVNPLISFSLTSCFSPHYWRWGRRQTFTLLTPRIYFAYSTTHKLSIVSFPPTLNSTSSPLTSPLLLSSSSSPCLNSSRVFHLLTLHLHLNPTLNPPLNIKMERPTPRVNSAMLTDYQGKTVRIIGRVLNRQAGNIIIQASDEGQVKVKLSQGSSISDDATFIEVIGKVSQSDLSVTELTSVDLGTDLDMGLVEKFVQLASLHPEVFPVQ